MAFCGSTARTTAETKGAAVQGSFWSFSQYYLTIKICIDFPALIRDCKRKPGLCINYNFFARSPQGPEDMGNYSLCRWSCWTPADKETCWWGHRAQGTKDSPPKTLTLILQLALSFALLLLSYFHPSWMSSGVEEGVCLSFSPLSAGSPLRHSHYYSLPRPPEGLFSRLLLSSPFLK